MKPVWIVDDDQSIRWVLTTRDPLVKYKEDISYQDS